MRERLEKFGRLILKRGVLLAKYIEEWRYLRENGFRVMPFVKNRKLQKGGAGKMYA